MSYPRQITLQAGLQPCTHPHALSLFLHTQREALPPRRPGTNDLLQGLVVHSIVGGGEGRGGDPGTWSVARPELPLVGRNKHPKRGGDVVVCLFVRGCFGNQRRVATWHCIIITITTWTCSMIQHTTCISRRSLPGHTQSAATLITKDRYQRR